MSLPNDARCTLCSMLLALMPLVLTACDNDAPERLAARNQAHAVEVRSPPPLPPQPSIDPPGSRGSSSLSSSDGTLAAMVEAALLAEPELHHSAIDVTAVDGTVYLRGKAKDRNARRLATQIATTVDGVKRVQNELFVTAGS
jgi:hypothetical protein